MSEPIITCESLSKAYRIGVQQKRSSTLSGAALQLLKAPIQNFRRLRKLNTFNGDQDADDIHWALKDVSFEVNEGDVVGVIGRNGAGKSTLLKILSRITDPTSGQVTLGGRVSSLLEVGTGFHPELTGRENVYLNGTVLGMTRKEVDSKFDEIVQFSGVEKFLDTPIKRYSSGMTVRLAFAVAAHLEPEILIIDEVLAVGDAEFQNKCLGKMKDVARGGRTVLFVSHNMGAVRNLCSKAIVLQKGEVAFQGSTVEAIAHHLKNHQNTAPQFQATNTDPQATVVEAVEIRQSGVVTGTIQIHQPFSITVKVRGPRARQSVLGIHVTDSEYQNVLHLSDEFIHEDGSQRDGFSRTCTLPAYLLNTGNYLLSVWIGERNLANHDLVENCVQFEVQWCGPMAELTRSDDWKGVSGPGIGLWKCNV